MADTRSRIEKLRAMALDESSPQEAAIARDRLKAMGVPLHPPAPNPDPVPDPKRERWVRKEFGDYTVAEATTDRDGIRIVVKGESPFVD